MLTPNLCHAADFSPAVIEVAQTIGAQFGADAAIVARMMQRHMEDHARTDCAHLYGQVADALAASA